MLQSEIKFKIFNFKSVCECSSCYKKRKRERDRQTERQTDRERDRERERKKIYTEL